jgi:hypothetical protein
MPVEAPVREPGGLHEIGQSGRGDPVLAEFSRGGRHDPLTCLRCFDFRFSHCFAFLNGVCAGKLPMTLDI